MITFQYKNQSVKSLPIISFSCPLTISALLIKNWINWIILKHANSMAVQGYGTQNTLWLPGTLFEHSRRNGIFGHMRTAKAQISLRIRAVWSGHWLSICRVIYMFTLSIRAGMPEQTVVRRRLLCRIFWTRLASFDQLGLISDCAIVNGFAAF